MSHARTLAKNTLFLLTATIFTNLAAFVWNVYLARYLGTAGFGILSAALALTGIFSILADLGMGTYITREIARDPGGARELASAGIGNRLLLSLMVLVMIILLPLTGIYRGTAAAVVMFIGGYMLVNSFSAFFNSMFQGFQRMEYQTIWNILNSLFILVGVLTVIWLGGTVVHVAIAYLVAAVLSVSYSVFIFTRRFFRPGLAFSCELITKGLPFGITSVFFLIYFWIDSVMLSLMKGDVSVGLYSAPYRLLTVISSLYTVYLLAVFPIMSRFHVESSDSLKFTYRRSVKYLMILAVIIILMVFVLAEPLIELIFSSKYLSSAPALRILITATAFMFLNGITSNLLGSTERQTMVTRVTGAGAIFNVTVNLILIPRFDFLGASAATVMTEFLMMVLFMRALRDTDYGPSWKDITDGWRILIPGAASAVILMAPVNIILRATLALAVYVAGIFLTGALDHMDRAIIRSIIRG
ncbi:flippase [Methanothermobacter sp. THM-2]|uniref:flippase n=1 Tax=Methanothermobacter sp. THM-2 TaxID=2606912 RepID=UPI001365DC66|nr:flippase [Methanothermobacter sp. THM-2]QHN08783.1 flippase [Methanothermobacter sp. THM-2]